jgi:hypothetical protein
MQMQLTGNWLLARDPENRGREEKWQDTIPEGARPAPVPGIVQQVFPTHQGVAWYWHTFSSMRLPGKGERCLLRFGAVEYLAEVWLNGLPAGGHEGAETPFELDVTGLLRPGGNLLAVRVVKPGDERIDGLVLGEIPHRNQIDHANFSAGHSYNIAGIIGRVELLVVPAVRIADIFARPDPATGRIETSVTIQNDSGGPVQGELTLLAGPAGPANGGDVLATMTAAVVLPPGRSVHELAVTIAQPRLWELDDPFLYRLTARLGGHELSIRCGFRDFRVKDWFFHLNGRRVFLRSSHTGNHFPAGQIVPVDPDHLRRDLILAKASGFNCIRWIAGVALPEQLDFCDELGLMVYEECYAAWSLKPSPKLAERFERSNREMILRDRNHPSVTIWGLLNETAPGPHFQQAVEFLPKLRALDPTRLVLLSSGRWDYNGPWDVHSRIGSVSNPGSLAWDCVWGADGMKDKPEPVAWDSNFGQHFFGGYVRGAGDAHVYPYVPQDTFTLNFIRNLGNGTKPVFLSEYGIGSLMNVIQETRGFEQAGVCADLADAAILKAQSEKLEADWRRLGFDDVYPFPEDMLRESQRLHSRQRRLAFDLIRSNPQLCGYNLTGLLDHGLTGEGLWTFWRRWKPGIAETLEDGWSPLRWCLFVSPAHGYAGEPLEVEAVLANEGALKPGTYPATFRVFGPDGVLWEEKASVEVDQALAVPVLKRTIRLNGRAGEYVFAANLERGGAPTGDRLNFRLADPVALPRLDAKIVAWGLDAKVSKWLSAHGVTCETFNPAAEPATRELILVGRPTASNALQAQWQALHRRLARGAAVIFLDPGVFRKDTDPVYWLPQANKGRCYDFQDCLYHKECVSRRHPVFEGLQAPGIMDWEYYGPVIPRLVFEGLDAPEEAMAMAFATGNPQYPGGYGTSLLLARFGFGHGRLILNTMNILDHVGAHPAADRLLLNLVRHGMTQTKGRMCKLPEELRANIDSLSYEHCHRSNFITKWRMGGLQESIPIHQAAPLPRPLKGMAHSFAEGRFANFYALQGNVGGLTCAQCRINAPRPMSADLLISTDGPCKIWLDGLEAGVVDPGFNPLKPGVNENVFPVALERGAHEITVAFDRDGGKAWGFSLRFGSKHSNTVVQIKEED